jgi:succinate dehydrogenase / fumarate reductase cytochrome b subunit
MSTVTLKIAMALSGAALVGFAAQHMFGHLIMFQGQGAYNDYAEFMQGLGGIKWGARLGLLGLVGLHIQCAILLKNRNVDARPTEYEYELKSQRTSLAAKTMLFGGAALFFFLVYHIAHFTLWVVDAPAELLDGEGRRDIYTVFVQSFLDLRILAMYLAAATFLALHLSHGVQSMFKTLGLAKGRFRGPIEFIGPAVGIFLWLGYIAPPLACYMQIINLDDASTHESADSHGDHGAQGHGHEAKKESH